MSELVETGQNDSLNKKEEQQHGNRRQIDAAEDQREQTPDLVEDRFGRAVQKTDDRVARIRVDPGDQSPPDDNINVELNQQIEELGKSNNQFT